MLYALVNLGFMVCVFSALAIYVRGRSYDKPYWRVLIAMLILTAVFDSAIIASGIVNYDEATIIGLKIGQAPVEDFAYTIVAWAAVPILYSALQGRSKHER